MVVRHPKITRDPDSSLLIFSKDRGPGTPYLEQIVMTKSQTVPKKYDDLPLVKLSKAQECTVCHHNKVSGLRLLHCCHPICNTCYRNGTFTCSIDNVTTSGEWKDF